MKFRPNRHSVPRPLTDMLPAFMDEPLVEMKATIDAKDNDQFVAAFDTLTAGCNGCHQAATFGFKKVIRPTSPPYSNQDFTPQEK